jgi:hypothetical protein
MKTTAKSPGIPVRFVLATVGPDDSLCCPICACRNVHPAEVIIEQGQTKTRVTRETTRVVPTNRSEDYLGSQIVLEFWCEQGHAFFYTFASLRDGTAIDLTARPAAHVSIRHELWRA